jgi:hypothetical protein
MEVQMGKSGRLKKRLRKTESARKRARACRRINAMLKGITLALEPPLNDDPLDLLPAFRTKLDAALSALLAAGKPFKLVEGFRTVDRQQWLYGSGRPTVKPYGRPGPILTNADGVKTLSKHQGTGVAGTATAADCYPTKNGKVYIPPAADPVWEAYALALEAQGLIAGHHWPTFKDSPHAELA